MTEERIMQISREHGSRIDFARAVIAEAVAAERERCAKACRYLMPPEGVIRRTLLDLEREILEA